MSSDFQEETLIASQVENWRVDLDTIGVASIGVKSPDDQDREIECLVVGIKPVSEALAEKRHLLLLDDNEAAELSVMLLQVLKEFREGQTPNGKVVQ